MILEIRANLPLLGREETFVVDGQSMPLAVALERFVLRVALVRACGFRLLCNDLIEEHRSAPSGADGKSCPVRFAHGCWVALRDAMPRIACPEHVVASWRCARRRREAGFIIA